MRYVPKKEKPYTVYLSIEHEPLNILAYSYAEVVSKAIAFIRENNLITTIKKIEEIKFV